MDLREIMIQMQVESLAGWEDDMDPRLHLLRQHHFFSITFNDSVC